jgi:D-alanyl-lipoteichoic acid acyltransferase DltB (MBOAT superfamily)
MEPVTDLVSFAAYTAFFPAMMAGPIDRANTFIPQLQAKRTFDYTLAVDGCRQILWGMFKKMMIADKIAVAVDLAWNGISETSGINLVVAAFLYTIQLYADFSGYSDMAIGVGKLLGFRITKNFNYPFFGRNIAEFWRNWHISLTSWLTDYVFTPLNFKFRNLGKRGTIFAVIINFVLVGLWHGADWTFAAFGFYQGLLYIPLILSGVFVRNSKLIVTKWGLLSLKDFARMLVTFVLVTFGLIIFRAASVGQAWEFIRQLVNNPLPLRVSGIGLGTAFPGALAAVGMFVLEWYGYRHKMEYGLCANSKLNAYCRYIVYAILCLIIANCLFGGEAQDFIYQQF